MTNSETNPLEDSLIFEDLLPISWTDRENEPQAINYTRVAEHNEHVMRCANLLGEQVRDKIDEESETESAMMRLEAKVNLLLEMVSKLNRSRSDIPDATQVKLAVGGVEWICQDSAPSKGSKIWINLYIDNRIPEAIKMAARVLTVYEEVQGSTVCARFEAVGDIVQDQLQKMIFRHHRRMVAQSRAG